MTLFENTFSEFVKAVRSHKIVLNMMDIYKKETGEPMDLLVAANIRYIIRLLYDTIEMLDISADPDMAECGMRFDLGTVSGHLSLEVIVANRIGGRNYYAIINMIPWIDTGLIKDDIVMCDIGGGQAEVQHPSSQAVEYREFLKAGKPANDSVFYTYAYMYDLIRTSNVDIEKDFIPEIISQAPVIYAGEEYRFEGLRNLVLTGNDGMGALKDLR